MSCGDMSTLLTVLVQTGRLQHRKGGHEYAEQRFKRQWGEAEGARKMSRWSASLTQTSQRLTRVQADLVIIASLMARFAADGTYHCSLFCACVVGGFASLPLVMSVEKSYDRVVEV